MNVLRIGDVMWIYKHELMKEENKVQMCGGIFSSGAPEMMISRTFFCLQL